MLTTGADTVIGGTGADSFNASEVGTTAGSAATWTAGDAIDGGAGDDTMNVTLTAAITAPAGVTIKNVETLKALSGATVTLDTTGYTGMTKVDATSKGGMNLTGAATTNLVVTETDQKLDTTSQTIVNGGLDVTVSAKGTTNNATALTAATGAGAEILIGATTAAAGNVTVTNSFKGATTQTSGDVFVKGGKVVSVTQTLTNTTVNETNVQGAVSVVGDANTTAVTVNQDATAAASAVGTGVVGKTAGAVTITDKNAASATAAGTITSVTLNNAGAAVVNSGALNTLNLQGTLVSVNAGTSGALTTAAVDTLALNLNGAKSTGTVTIDTDIKTLNIAGNTAASTLASLSAAGATKVNVSGDAKVTLTDATLTAVTDIVVTNTAGAAFGTTAIGAAVNFTGGAGADAVILSNAFEKAITMGAGDDTVTYGGAASTATGKVGSVAAGDGIDTIVMTSAQANSASGTAVFNGSFTGFEVLKVSDALAAAVDMDGINGASKVILAAGANAGTINNLVSGGTVDVLASNAGALAINVKSALTGTSDVVNLNLLNTAVLTGNTVTIANVETVNIGTKDATVVTSTALGADAAVHTLTLTAADATKVTVAGNNGLTLTATGSTKVTTFDASGVVANDTAQGAGFAATTDTAANLAVTYTSLNSTATANVSITGGDGNDVLTGNAAIDNITGGKGSDVLSGRAGADIINVGIGNDVVLVASTDAGLSESSTAAADKVNGFVMSGAITSATALANTANWIANAKAAAGANASVLGIDMTTSAAGAQAITVEGDATGAGQMAGVTYKVASGILTLSGAGASSVDTIGEWLTEAAAVAATNGDILAFEFGGDTYVYGQNGSADVLVQLVGVTGAAALAEGGAATTGVANTIHYLDL